MMYNEFMQISGNTVDYEEYKNEIEPVYMEFEELTKQEIAAMYFGMKPGAYLLWEEARSMTKEQILLDTFLRKLEDAGLKDAAFHYVTDFSYRKSNLTRDVKRLKLNKLKQFKQQQR